jgi:signal transduction histidine kinase
MIARLGIRARLTLLVSAVFAVASALAAVALVDAAERQLVDQTLASAEAVLGDYLTSFYGGVPTVALVDASEGTTFFWLDTAGNDLSELTMLDRVLIRWSAAAGYPTPDQPTAGRSNPAGSTVTGEGAVTAGRAAGPVFDAVRLPGGGVTVDPETGQLIGAGGALVRLATSPVAIGSVRTVDRGAEVMAVAQRLELPDGSQLDVGVSTPIRPVSNSLGTLRTILWITVPTLVAAVALITWLAATRALRPVDTITRRTRAITATNLSERVPVPPGRDDVHQLARTMNDMLSRLQRAQQVERQLVADASHELRSPVAASRAQLEVALAHPEAADWAATARVVLDEQLHLGHVIENLLALSRIDEQGVGAVTDVDLEELVSAEAARPHAKPVLAVAPRPVRIEGNPALVARAVRNLVDNAVRHAATGVTIGLRPPGAGSPASAAVVVDDDGPGVPADQRIRIFDRFTRLDSARRKDDGGTGLGLAIAREVARAHNGSISCEDAPGGGARFVLHLPLERDRRPPELTAASGTGEASP